MEKELLKIIEEENINYIELMSCKEYRFGKNFISLLNSIKKLDVKLVKGILKKNLAEKKISKLYPATPNIMNKSREKWEKELLYIGKPIKIAVYTCIVGGYDEIQNPNLNIDGVDYFIFTDKSIDSKIWQKKDVPQKLSKFNNTEINRYIKFHPKEFFQTYDYTIYIDGNVKVVSDLRPIVHYADIKSGVAMHKHVLRNCIYDEAEICVLYGKGNPKNIRKQMEEYKSVGFPKNYGMNEATIIITNNSSYSEYLLDQWWLEFMNSSSNRDQLAWPFVLWKNGLKIDDIGCLGDNLYKNPKFRIKSH